MRKTLEELRQLILTPTQLNCVDDNKIRAGEFMPKGWKAVRFFGEWQVMDEDNKGFACSHFLSIAIWNTINGTRPGAKVIIPGF